MKIKIIKDVIGEQVGEDIYRVLIPAGTILEVEEVALSSKEETPAEQLHKAMVDAIHCKKPCNCKPEGSGCGQAHIFTVGEETCLCGKKILNLNK